MSRVCETPTTQSVYDGHYFRRQGLKVSLRSIVGKEAWHCKGQGPGLSHPAQCHPFYPRTAPSSISVHLAQTQTEVVLAGATFTTHARLNQRCHVGKTMLWEGLACAVYSQLSGPCKQAGLTPQALSHCLAKTVSLRGGVTGEDGMAMALC